MPPFDVTPGARLAHHPAGGVVEPDRAGARVVRTGVGADHALPQIGELQPLILEIALDHLDHGPLEEQRPRLAIAAQSPLDLVAVRRGIEPQVAGVGRPQRVAQPPLHRLHRPPPGEVLRREPLDLGLAALVVVPELDAAAILERNEEAADRGHPPEPVSRQVQLVDDGLVEQPGHIGAGRHPNPGPRLVHGAGTAHAIPRLQHQHLLTRPGQIRGAGEAVVAGPDDDRVPPAIRQVGDRLRQADASQYRGGAARGNLGHRRA